MRIQSTLKHLLDQKGILPSTWEVIVVDNKSTDNTAQIALTIWNGFNVCKPSFKVVLESTPGLSHARKKGIEAAEFDYVLFCDDDNWLNDDYLVKALIIMQKSPFIGALGGEGYPVFEDKEPPYFWVNQYHSLAVGPQFKTEGDITDTRGVLYGAGMVLNKTAFLTLIEKFQFQFLASDRVGNTLKSGGDHELCFALKKIGYRIYFTKQLKFRHFIPAERTKIIYYKNLFLEFGKSFALLKPYRIDKQEKFMYKNDYRYICLRSLKNIFIIKLKLAVKGYFFDCNNYKYLDDLHQFYNNVGIFKTSIRLKNSFKNQMSTHPIFFKD